MISYDIMVGLFLDFSKAFDTLDHQILLSKLQLYGIHNTSLNWVKSYLSNRSQYVEFDSVQSNITKLLCGVPQGSILGPLFFLLYINDLVNISSFLFYILFADDSNAFFADKDLDTIIKTFNKELASLADWLNANKLTLNVKKTHYIVFTNSLSPSSSIDLTINGQIIDRVTHTRFLGVIIDEHLRFKHHINLVKSKVAKGIGILSRASKFFNSKTLTDIYHAFIHPYLIYCVEIWGSTYSTAWDPIHKLQKRAVRIITRSKFNTPSADLFKLLKIVPFPKLHTFYVYTFLYKVRNSIAPKIICDEFQVNSDIHGHFTRQSKNIHVRQISSALRERSLHHQAITIHNCDESIDYDLPYHTFKYFVKTVLLFT